MLKLFVLFIRRCWQVVDIEFESLCIPVHYSIIRNDAFEAHFWQLNSFSLAAEHFFVILHLVRHLCQIVFHRIWIGCVFISIGHLLKFCDWTELMCSAPILKHDKVNGNVSVIGFLRLLGKRRWNGCLRLCERVAFSWCTRLNCRPAHGPTQLTCSSHHHRPLPHLSETAAVAGRTASLYWLLICHLSFFFSWCYCCETDFAIADHFLILKIAWSS